MSQIFEADLNALLEIARARVGSAPAGELRIVHSERVASGLSPVPTVVATATGTCKCLSGWTFADDGTARKCTECRDLRGLAERTTAAGLPGWALRVRQEWRGGGKTLAAMAATATQVIAGRVGPLLHGACGTGKSWRAMAIALAALDAGASVRWAHWPAIPHALRDGFAAGRTTASMLRGLASCDVLFLDDIGAEAGKREWLDDLAYQVIGPRADAARPVVVTTNLDPASLAKLLGDRVCSRLTACCRAVRVDGADRRLEG